MNDALRRHRAASTSLEGDPSIGLSIVLPAYNEEPNVERAVNSAIQIAARLVPTFEVIVVNDGSVDGTMNVLRRLHARHHPRLRVLTHETMQGYGGALLSGFAAATGSLVFFTDSDNQFDMRELEHFLPLTDRFDIVVGFRIRRQDLLVRRLVAWLYNRLVGVLFRLRVRDVDCAFKLMRREVIDELALECEDSFISAELLARARRRNYRIAERGVRHYPRTAGTTTVRVAYIPATLRTIWRMWWRIHFPRRLHSQGAAGAERRQVRITELAPQLEPPGSESGGSRSRVD